MTPYTTLYRRWIAAPGVGAAEIAVLSGLYARADSAGVCAGLVQDELAAELGKSRPWLSAVLTKLQAPDLSLVEARRERGFRGMVYALVGAQDTDSSGRPADTAGQPADGLLRTGNPLNPDSQNSSSFRAGGSVGSPGIRDRDPLAEDWQPDAADLAWAAETRPEVDPATVTRKFVCWCRKANVRNGYSPSDPSGAWRKWVARELVAPAAAPEGETPEGTVVPFATASRRPTNRSDHNDRQPAELPREPSRQRRSADTGHGVAARNAGVLSALRDRLARPA
ncbi:hypothetical protein GBZ26_10905 [Azospirillum formosense]|uniref:MarR family transcriptional regulator n=1 Tax=Azospirillum formosense TaxID=861533 RepID=A0ABX2KSV4_9PROT|nr:hypothetical protein [Azospirillum formosense]MBY3756991.1 hypothetical protein [Azospirillum formosense]NUB19721.1 hypothetical protein [Azospirillum formosense]